jgi:hypothetical protein
MPYAVIGSSERAKRFPFSRTLDVLRGRVRWIPNSGWCEQNLIEIVAEPVAAPTPNQIRFAQAERPSLGNFLEIRTRLIEGGRFGFGPLFSKQETEFWERKFRDVGLPYRLVNSRIWRPLGFCPQNERVVNKTLHRMPGASASGESDRH